MMSAPRSEQGFTLIELVVALALFALISLAGVRLIDTVLNVERTTNGRLEELAQLQRTMYIVSADLEQIDGDISINGDRLRFARMTPNGSRTIEYRHSDHVLERVTDGQPRALLNRIDGIKWRFHKFAGGWTDTPSSQADPSRPDGVELDIQLASRDRALTGNIRRVVSLPQEATAWP